MSKRTLQANMTCLYHHTIKQNVLKVIFNISFKKDNFIEPKSHRKQTVKFEERTLAYLPYSKVVLTLYQTRNLQNKCSVFCFTF